MIKHLLYIFFLVFANLELLCQVYVNGYYRKDGTYVQPHYRTNPNSNPYDNYSYPGNFNPHTGKTANGNPDTYIRNLREDNNSTPSSRKNSIDPKTRSFSPNARPSVPNANTEIKYSTSSFQNGSREQALVRNGMTPQTNKNSNFIIDRTYLTTAEKLNVRSGPSTQFDVIAILPKGSLVSISEVYNQSWVKIVFGQSEGFVHRDYLADYK